MNPVGLIGVYAGYKRLKEDQEALKQLQDLEKDIVSEMMTTEDVKEIFHDEGEVNPHRNDFMPDVEISTSLTLKFDYIYTNGDTRKLNGIPAIYIQPKITLKNRSANNYRLLGLLGTYYINNYELADYIKINSGGMKAFEEALERSVKPNERVCYLNPTWASEFERRNGYNPFILNSGEVRIYSFPSGWVQACDEDGNIITSKLKDEFKKSLEDMKYFADIEILWEYANKNTLYRSWQFGVPGSLNYNG